MIMSENILCMFFITVVLVILIVYLEKFLSKLMTFKHKENLEKIRIDFEGKRLPKPSPAPSDEKEQYAKILKYIIEETTDDKQREDCFEKLKKIYSATAAQSEENTTKN